MPPLQFTVPEALGLLTGLALMSGSPYAAPARTAARKLTAALPMDHRDEALALLDTVYFVTAESTTEPQHKQDLMTALAQRRVIEIEYRGTERTRRVVEPLGLLQAHSDWLLLGWCRLRDGIRGFRTDRITSLRLTDAVAPVRDPDLLRRDLSRWRIATAADPHAD